MGGRIPRRAFVIEHRGALIYMPCEAAELEPGIMCHHYLFAACSLGGAQTRGSRRRNSKP